MTPHDQLGAQIEVVASYVETLAQCQYDDFVVVQKALPELNTIDWTYRRHWHVSACKVELDMTLDCDVRGGLRWVCRPREWPDVVRTPGGFPMALRLEAVAREAERIVCDPAAC